MALLADLQDFVGRALPPVASREDFDLVEAGIAFRFHGFAQAGQVNHPVAHHAAVEQQVGGGHQPVAEVEGQQAFLPGPAICACSSGSHHT